MSSLDCAAFTVYIMIKPLRNFNCFVDLGKAERVFNVSILFYISLRGILTQLVCDRRTDFKMVHFFQQFLILHSHEKHIQTKCQVHDVTPIN